MTETTYGWDALLPSSKRGLVLFAIGDRGMEVIVQVVRMALAIPQLSQ